MTVTIFQTGPWPYIFLFFQVLFCFIFCLLFKTCSNSIIWGPKWIQKNIKLVLLKSLFNLQAQHAICFAFCKSCKCIFVERQCDAYYGTNCISNNWSNYAFQNFMNIIWLWSLSNVATLQHWNLTLDSVLEVILKLGREKYYRDKWFV